MAGTFTSLHIRNFRLYVIGMNISFTGAFMLRIALAFLVLRLSGGNGIALGVVTGLTYLPLLVVGSWSGVLADRYAKRTLLFFTASTMGAIALVIGVLDVTGEIVLWQVYVLAFLFGTVSAIDQPTRLSFVVEMVGPDSLANAVALNSASANAARLVGPALAGVLIAAIGTGWVILLYALGTAAVVVALAMMRTSELHDVPRVARAKGQFRAGIRYVRGNADLRAVFATIVILGTFAMTQETLLPLMASHVFGGGAPLYGLLAVSLAVGAFIGALLAARRGRPSISFFSAFAAAYGASWLLTAVMPTPVATALVLPLMGITQITCITAANATVQLSVIPEMRGRVMALYMTVLLGGAPVGAVLAGWIAQVSSPRVAMVVSGLAALVAAGFGRLVYLSGKRTDADVALAQPEVGAEADAAGADVLALTEVGQIGELTEAGEPVELGSLRQRAVPDGG